MVGGLVVKFIISVRYDAIWSASLYSLPQSFQIDLRGAFFLCALEISIVKTNKLLSKPLAVFFLQVCNFFRAQNFHVTRCNVQSAHLKVH